jgi:hypothetical protein
MSADIIAVLFVGERHGNTVLFRFFGDILHIGFRETVGRYHRVAVFLGIGD